MLETYSEAIVQNCTFHSNEAADNGGAILIEIRSQIKLYNSFFKLNKAKNSGGSILVQHSQVIINSCTFLHELANLGLGGAICAENVANVTIQGSLFYYCTASYGGSLSVKSETVLTIENSNISGSSAINEGGSVYIFQNSFVIGKNLTVADALSVLGAGIYVHDTSKLNLNRFHLLRNTVIKSGGALYCIQSHVVLDNGILIGNYAKLNGGVVFSDNCQVTIDHSTIVNNTGLNNGGGLYSKISTVEIHNTRGVNNSVGNIGDFAVFTMNSTFISNNLHLPSAEEFCISIFNRSKAEMKHTYLLNLKGYCPIVVRKGSDILVQFIHHNDTKEQQLDFERNENFVCTDDNSNSNGTLEGM